MTDIFESPQKSGYGIGVCIIITDTNGNQISKEGAEMFGFDNATVDLMRRQVVDAHEELVEQWKKYKAEGTTLEDLRKSKSK